MLNSAVCLTFMVAGGKGQVAGGNTFKNSDFKRRDENGTEKNQWTGGQSSSSDKSGCDDVADVELACPSKKFVFIRPRYGTWIDDEIFCCCVCCLLFVMSWIPMEAIGK